MAGRLRPDLITKPFKRTIAVDQRDSVPDWEPFVQPVTRKWPAPLASEVPRPGRPFTVATTDTCFLVPSTPSDEAGSLMPSIR